MMFERLYRRIKSGKGTTIVTLKDEDEAEARK